MKFLFRGDSSALVLLLLYTLNEACVVGGFAAWQKEKQRRQEQLQGVREELLDMAREETLLNRSDGTLEWTLQSLTRENDDHLLYDFSALPGHKNS